MELERYYESRMSPKTVIVPWGIKMIGRNAFSFCRKVEKIVLPGSLIDIYEEAFSFCENLKEIIIPKGVKQIKSRAFYGCRSLTHIELPDSVQEIGGGIFDNCPGIQKVKLPNNVEIKEWLINDPIFDMSSFNQESPDHTIVNGVVFSKDGTELITYLKNKQDAKYTVPAGVRVIRKNAFKGNQYLTEVIIPEGVTRIGGRAFEGCMNLRSATIPASVTEMGVNVEHYIISSGLKELIEGTSIAKYFKQIYACSFMYENDKAVWPAVAVDFTSKTQFIFMINKGILDIWRNAQINDSMPDEGRPVPFQNMIYLGDGETDIPSMRIVKSEGGHSIAIYKPGNDSSRAQARNLVHRGRVNFACPGDYREGSELYNSVLATIAKVKTGSDFHKLERQNQKSMLED